MLKSLSGLLVTTETKRQRELGRVPLRRLNRTEYENTMRDLFAIPGLEVKEMLPEDGRFDGFDKAAKSLDMSSVQLRKYLEAAEYVLLAAIAHQDKPMVWKQRLRRIGGLAQFGESSFPIKNGQPDMELIKEMHRTRENGKKMPLQEKGALLQTMDSLGIITHARPAYIPMIENFSPFHSGYYRITTSVWSFEYDKGQSLPSDRMQSFALTANSRVLAYLDAPPLKPTVHEKVVWLNAAETLELNPANLWGNYNTPLNYQGPGVAVDYVGKEDQKAYVGNLFREFPAMREALDMLKSMAGKGAHHSPKMGKLQHIMRKHFSKNGEFSRVMIFTSFRDSVHDIVRACREMGDETQLDGAAGDDP